MAEYTQKRYGELSRAVLDILGRTPDGLSAAETLERVATEVPPTPFEQEDWPNFPGVRRYEKVVRFATIAPVKAGWLAKSAGTWTVTPAGRQALTAHHEPVVFYREAVRLYNEWKKGRSHEPSSGEVDIPTESAVSLDEAREAAWSDVKTHLANLPPYDFQELVAALLRAMDYHVAWIAPPGADGGMDILAFGDPLGATGPRIKVQVKRQDARIGSEGLRSFKGILGTDDIGIFVCTGGFTGPAESEALRETTRRLTLIDLESLYRLWIEHQRKIPEQHRRLLPLTPVYYLDLPR
jgi:restriction system protein